MEYGRSPGQTVVPDTGEIDKRKHDNAAFTEADQMVWKDKEQVFDCTPRQREAPAANALTR